MNSRRIRNLSSLSARLHDALCERRALQWDRLSGSASIVVWIERRDLSPTMVRPVFCFFEVVSWAFQKAILRVRGVSDVTVDGPEYLDWPSVASVRTNNTQSALVLQCFEPVRITFAGDSLECELEELEELSSSIGKIKTIQIRRFRRSRQ